MSKLCYCFFIGLFLFVSGCSNSDASNLPKSMAATNPTESASVASIADQKVLDIDTGKLQGKIQHIYYISKNQILILADKIYLYDLFTGNIVSQTEKDGLIDERYQVLDNGVAAIGFSEDGYVVSCILYDRNLNKRMEISGTEFMGQNESIDSTETMSVSKDGSKLVFGTNTGLFLYDINHKTNTTLVDLANEDPEKHKGLVRFDQVELVNDDSMVVFKSQSFDVPAVDGKDSFDTYGTIHIDGSQLNVRRSTDYFTKQLIAYNSFALFAEDFTVPSGRLMTFDYSSAQTKLLKTETQKESGYVSGSEEGKFFATSGVEKGTIVIRVYDTKSGSMVMKKEIQKGSKYMQRAPEVRVLDDTRTCIVLLGNKQKELTTQCQVFSF